MFELNRKKGAASKLRAIPESTPQGRAGYHLQRTLRIPDDGKDYPLPRVWGVCPCAISRTARASYLKTRYRAAS